MKKEQFRKTNTSDKIEKCILCNGDVELVLELSPTPPANELLDCDDPDKELYDLNLMQCKKCNHTQIDTEISKSRLYKHYIYASTVNSNSYKHFTKYANDMLDRFDPKFIIDIGSNDGLFLHCFGKIRKLGVDPAANIVEIAKSNDINTICGFFNEMLALDIRGKQGTADLITANNVFAHNKNLSEILKGVKHLLAERGTFVFEVAYGKSMMENNLFDLIYHEHIHHWHLRAAVRYVKKFGLQVYDADIVNTHGGSIRVFVEHDEDFNGRSAKLDKLLNEEKDYSTLTREFANRVSVVRENLVSLLKQIKLQGKTVSILGYPAKACTLSYYFGLDSNLITEIFDDNVLKIGKYSHKGFKIQPASNIYKNKPDYLLILSWNYAEDLMQKHELFKKTGGKFIVPLPEVVVW